MLTEKQRLDRKLGIGGSDVGIILGLSSFKTAYELWLEKTGVKEIIYEETEQQYWGSLLEPVIVAEYKKRHNVEVSLPDTTIHPFYNFMRANVDGFIKETNTVLEAKCANSFMAKEWGPVGSDLIPLSYLTQAAHYVSVFNADKADIALLLGGNEYREYIYTRNAELEQKVINACKNFWDAVTNKVEPLLQTLGDLKIKYQKSMPGKTLEVNEKMLGILPQLSENIQKKKELAEMEKEHRFEIISFMEDAEVLTDLEGRPVINYKANKNGVRSFKPVEKNLIDYR